MPHSCVYATAGWGVHDERWVAGLREVGHAPRVVSLGRDVPDERSLCEAVLRATDSGQPVLAGPLHTVARPLAALPLRIVGLSWGYDLHDADAAGDDLSWIAAMRGLIVDSLANRAIAERVGFPSHRITFLPWGVDLKWFRYHPPRVNCGQPQRETAPRVILSLRAHEDKYRVGDILEAFSLVPRRAEASAEPDPVLEIGHSGSQTEQLMRRARELSIEDRARFIGSVSEASLHSLLVRASCYVTASEVDGTSVTLLQAMASGTPVVASATPGNLGWIQEGITGSTFPVGDVEALARCMQRVLDSDPSLMVSTARTRVEQDADWPANLPRLAEALAQSQRT